MYVNPSTSFEAVLDDGTAGLGSDLELAILDNVGGTTQAFSTANISEIAAGVYAGVRTSPGTAGQYSIIWKLVSTGEIRGVDDLTVSYTAAGSASPSGRDLCTLADVISYVPAYVANDITNAKLQQLLSAESDLIHDETGREIVAKATQPATRTFEISTKDAQLRQVNIGDLASTDGLVVSILNWDGTVSRTVDLSAIVPLYEGERQPTRDWEPITELYFPWGRPQMPVFIPLQALELTGTFGFPQIPRFVREACAKRVIIRYVSDVAHLGTDFANAVEQGNLNLAAMFDAAEDAIAQLSGRVVLA